MKLNHFAAFLNLLEVTSAWNHITKTELLELGRHGRVLIAYVLPDEANCQALEPEWAALQGSKGDEVVSIDCSAEAKLCQDAGVSSIPAIRLHHPDGGQMRYRGPRDAASIKGFLDRTRRPAVSHASDQNATAFQSIDGVVFIGHFGAGDTSLQGWFEVSAEKYHDRYSFAVSTAKQQQKGPVLECYNNIDGIQRSTMDFPNPSSIERFVKLCSTPLIPELTRRNELSFYEERPDRTPTKTNRDTDRFKQTRKSIVHYFVSSKEEREDYVAQMRPLAKKYEEYLHFVTTDINEYPDAAEMMGVKRGSRGLSVQNPNNGDVYPYTRRAKIGAKTVEAFLGDIIQGKVQPWRPGAGHDEL